MPDLNARTAEMVANLLDPPRTSMDKESRSTRGRWLCKLFNDYRLAFVSGGQVFGPNSGKYTSFQGERRTVIDYAVCSKALFPKIDSFWVDDRVEDYDDAALTLNLKVNLDLQNITFVSPRKKRKIGVVLPDETELDKLLISTLAVGKDEDKKLLALYGPVTQITTPMKVTVHGSCRNAGKISATAGAATYWGPNACLNTSARIWGTQTSP